MLTLRNREELKRGKQLPQRILLYVFGVFVLSLGAIFVVNADLGASPVQAVPLVASLITGLSIGTSFFVILTVFTLLQICILRRGFQWIQLTQILAAFLFGYLVDFSNFLVGVLRIPGYFGQLLMLGIGIVLTASGVTLHMRARIINLPPEALTAAITSKIPNGVFHRVRIVQDSALVVIAVLLSFLFLGGLYGVREGTVITAILVGKCIQYTNRVWVPLLKRLDFNTEE